MSQDEDTRPIFSGLSALGIFASVGAAVTAAYIASRLGVAGTMIGVAVASLVSTVAATTYSNALERGRRAAKTVPLLPLTGTTTEQTRIDPDASTITDDEDLDDVDDLSELEYPLAEERRGFPWRRALISGAVVLALSLSVIFAYEAITGNGFGSQDEPGIGNIVRSGSSDTSQQDQEQPAPDSEEPTVEPTEPVEPEPEPTAEQPDPEPTTDPDPPAGPDGDAE